MEKLSDQYDGLLKNPLLKTLIAIVRSFDGRLASQKDHFATLKSMLDPKDPDALPWMAHFHAETPPPLREILAEVVDDKKDAYEALEGLQKFLQSFLYMCNMFLFSLDEENAHQRAIGAPQSMWLVNNVDCVDACCSVNMFLLRLVHPEPDSLTASDIPDYLLRIPIGLNRFRELVLPWVKKLHQGALEEFKDKDYLALFIGPQTDEKNNEDNSGS